MLDTVLPQLEGEEPIPAGCKSTLISSIEEDPFTILDYYTGGKIFVIRCATSTGGFPTFCRLV